MESDPGPALRRVEEALQLIQRHDALNYSRITRHLDRIWVHVIASAQAHYDRSLNACVIDERYALGEAMTLEKLASTIVHEATHARLEGWGIVYVEERRARIEAICLRRELRFAAKLPDGEPLRDEIVRTLEWCAANSDQLSDARFRERDDQGQPETLRYLGAPAWLIGFLMRIVRRRRLRTESRAQPSNEKPPAGHCRRFRRYNIK
ncbi:hypothetical protein JQ628_32625 [Bradyrhizobium lablabi]|uniref:hypothetical protein n=1 Tax=Bradyrhizobium lablabi TaxID=722472 RepID=UPI001BA4F8E4|nr:hypothetical protein [Bradyrhizobium lablabi]MBR1126303.1 hypothetical protein [Bradyrhizobium lablabi]